jgi:hypothetical protein
VILENQALGMLDDMQSGGKRANFQIIVVLLLRMRQFSVLRSIKQAEIGSLVDV